MLTAVILVFAVFLDTQAQVDQCNGQDDCVAASAVPTATLMQLASRASTEAGESVPSYVGKTAEHLKKTAEPENQGEDVATVALSYNKKKISTRFIAHLRRV